MRIILSFAILAFGVFGLIGEVLADEIIKDKPIIKIEIFDGPEGELHGIYVDSKKMYILDTHTKAGLKILEVVQYAAGDKGKRLCLAVKKDMIKKVSPFVNGSCQ